MIESRAFRVLALAGSLLTLAGATAAEEMLVDGIAAQVGGSIVLLSEVTEMSAPVEIRMREGGAPMAEIMVMRADVLDRLIEQRLIEDVVKRLELSTTDQEVNAAIEGIALDAGLSIEQLKASVASHGLSFEEYRAKIAKEIERSKVLGNMVRSKVRVEPHEVEAAYLERYANQSTGGEEVHVKLILVTFGAHVHRDHDTACSMVAEAATNILSGTLEFSAAATEISEDPNASRGGDLGWIHKDQLAGWMAPPLVGLSPGQISDVVRTGFGCGLLQLVDRRPFEPVSLEQARPTLENEIFRRKMEAEYVKWTEEMRAHTFIERKGIFAEAERLRSLNGPTRK
jgi:peptidyl-prolyl cis-trans isomerase SurA